MKQQKDHFSVEIPSDVYPLPSLRELSAARLLCAYFQKNITIVATSNRKTPDFRIGNVLWELKTPTGSGKYNIQHLLHTAIQQSPNIIVDARFSKMHISRIRNELQYHSRITTKGIKNLLLITKGNKIIVII